MLAELFKKYSSPPGSGTVRGTDKGTVHSYAETYEELFASRRFEPLEIVEIGVDSGASLEVWADYFPAAHVTGIDISLDNLQYGKHHPRISVYETNAVCMNPEKRYDILIDDGSHQPEDQLRAIEIWGPFINDLMIIEDVNLKKNPHLGAALKWTASKVGFDCEIRDLRSSPESPEDDVLAILRKKKK
jgi:hypothetical protein